MTRQIPFVLFVILFFIAFSAAGARGAEPGNGQQTRPDTSAGDAMVSEYFRLQTAKLTEASLAEIETLDDWQKRRDGYRRQLQEMLGLDPMPERTDLHAEVTGMIENHGIVVENLHFQAMPGLYVTGNLYRPADATEPLPTILYVCGHAKAVKDGVSLGNKTAYQHHGAWFARNGYVCLTIDTIQLGEIEGYHHGTYRYGMWWWNNRGYTPAGVEAWNCIRALDYLQSRPEVDSKRIGITGRSGGGVYSWWTAALDDRIAVAVPVAGITSLHNHVVDGCVEGHCDCMYMVNTYRWDFANVAALVAPRPLLISNSDKDRIFPLEGVVDVHAKVRRIYHLHDAGGKLGLQITEGPHKDTQELHIHAFRWFNRFLRDTDEMIEMTAVKLFDPEQLRVFEEIPQDQRVTTIHESFVPAASADQLPETSAELAESISTWQRQLDDKTFRGWPTDDEQEPLEVRQIAQARIDRLRVRKIEFTSQTPYRLPIYLVEKAQPDESKLSAKTFSGVDVFVLAQDDWDSIAAGLAVAMPAEVAVTGDDPAAWKAIIQRAHKHPDRLLAYVPPRGVGPTQWTTDERARTHIRRRFMLLGQTDDAMRIWDVRRALQALQQIEGISEVNRSLHGTADSAAIALYAALYEDNIASLELIDPPKRNRDGLSLLNVSKFIEMPQLVLMAASKVGKVSVGCPADQQESWQAIADQGDLVKRVDQEAGRISVTPVAP